MEEITTNPRYEQAFMAAKDYRRKWDPDARKSFGFYASRQWDENDLRKLKEEERPALTFNKIKKFIHSISGSEMSNRYEPKFIPRSMVEGSVADVLSEIVRYLREKTNGEQQDSAAFRDALICGVGCVEFYQDYETEREGTTKYKRVPIFEMYWDPCAQEANLLDAKEIFREKWIDEMDFRVMWPEKYEMFAGSFGVDPSGGWSPDKHQPRFDPYGSADEIGAYDPKENRVRVVEHQWYEIVHKYQVEGFQIDPMSGQAMPVLDLIIEEDETGTAEEKLEALKGQAEAQGVVINSQALPSRRYKRAFYVGSILLSEEDCPINDFTYKFITGYEDRHDDDVVYWQGIVHDLIDPQQYANKWFSQITHVVSTNPKGATIVKAGTFDNPAQAKKEWAKPNPMLIANGDIETNIKIVEGKYPTQIEHLYEHANMALHDIIGVNTNYFVPGVDNLNRTANTAIQSIQKQSMIVLSLWFDNLRLFRREQGRTYLEFIKKYLPEGAIVRITKDGRMAPQAFQRAWVDDVEYEVIVEESPTSPSKRHELWNSLQQTQSLDVLMQYGLFDGYLIAEIIPDLTEEQRIRIKQNWDRMMQMQAQQAQAQQASPQQY